MRQSLAGASHPGASKLDYCMNSSGDIMADNDGDSAFGPRSGQKVLTVQAVMPRETDRNPDGS